MTHSLLFFLRACASALVLVGSTLHAQEYRPSPESVAQIADAVLAGVLTPEFIRLTKIDELGLHFDRKRTMAAFGAVDDTTPLAALGFTRSVNPGSQDMLEDCNQAGFGECAKLLGLTYVYLTPVSMSGRTAVVDLRFLSAARGSGKRAIMSIISTQVHLSRTRSGPWRFVRTGLSLRS